MDINEVGSTAFFPSCVRAMEKDEARPLFEDPFAAWFIDEEATAKFRRLIRTFPAVRETARYRVCIMNETLECAIADGVKQVVTLGAGFDMRSQIFRVEGVRFCDVDQPAVLAFKRKILEARGVAPCTPIPGNYLELDLPGELAEAGSTWRRRPFSSGKATPCICRSASSMIFWIGCARGFRASSSPSIISQNR